jgi:hypothetical protein
MNWTLCGLKIRESKFSHLLINNNNNNNKRPLQQALLIYKNVAVMNDFRMKEILKAVCRVTDFDEIWYERYPISGHPKPVLLVFCSE